MTRRKSLHAAALSTFVLLTIPGFALLCRGHSPSRFAASNLPFWERSLPREAIPLAAPSNQPAAPSAVQFTGGALIHQLVAVNFNNLFYALEHPSHSATSASAGRPGLWLQTACALGRENAPLRQSQDSVATRLMSAQDNDGYLAAGKGSARWSKAEIIATAANMRGLLTYYAISRNPAAVYSAMQAGDLVATRFPPAGLKSPGTNGLVLPMVLLYQATSEPRYLRWAVSRAAMGDSDGLGLCALYQATGDSHYLRAAQATWNTQVAAKQRDPDLAASLWTLTGAPEYLHDLRTSGSPWPCPTALGSLAYARIRGGIAINVLTPSRARFGTAYITQHTSPASPSSKAKTAIITVQTVHPTTFTLRLNFGAASRKSSPTSIA